MDLPTLLRVQKEIKEVQRVMCENENSHDLCEMIKDVCLACDYEIFKLINEAKDMSIMERLAISDDAYQVAVCKILDSHNERLNNLEKGK